MNTTAQTAVSLNAGRICCFIFIVLNLFQLFVMDAVIRVKAFELDIFLLERIKQLVSGNDDAVVTISVNDNQEYFETLARSKKDLETRNNLISFTMEELVEYSAKKD